MSQWLDGALARAATVDDWLAPKRQQSLALLKETPWPNRRTEDWKYTSLVALKEQQFNVSPPASSVTLAPIPGVDSLDLHFVDGVLQTDLSALNAFEGVTVRRLDDDSQDWVADSFASVKPRRHLFGLVNDALATGGIAIDIADTVELARPIRIQVHTSANSEAHCRVLLRLGQRASATIIEQFSGSENSFNTSVAEFELGVESRLTHYRLALQTGEAMSVGGDHFRLAEASQLKSTVVGFGGKLSRVNVDVQHCGERAQAELNAIYLLNDDELFDLHSNIEHVVPHCQTQEKVRGIVAGQARAVFNGRIHIHRHAQKTVAELNNLNLLMSPRAEVDTKPELEIYADDVRCAHGATVAEIDKRSLYYLQSRGISRSDAQVMLSFGFINEIVNEMDDEALAEWLRPQLRARFEKMKLL